MDLNVKDIIYENNWFSKKYERYEPDTELLNNINLLFLINEN